MIAKTEKSRIARLRRLAARDGESFHKTRTPNCQGGYLPMINYYTVNANNYMTAEWISLEDAETAFGVS
jgi:hypothetical protein